MATMMTEHARPQRCQATYQDVLDAPEGMIAEIIGGELWLQPRPTPRHSEATGGLLSAIDGPFRRAVNGPGGWIILIEPEVHLEDAVLVPDLAGWRTVRLPMTPDTAFINLAPDWVCEILSPLTRAKDIGPKRQTWAQTGVGRLWHVDPAALLSRPSNCRTDTGSSVQHFVTASRCARRPLPRWSSRSMHCGREGRADRKAETGDRQASDQGNPSPAWSRNRFSVRTYSLTISSERWRLWSFIRNTFAPWQPASVRNLALRLCPPNSRGS